MKSESIINVTLSILINYFFNGLTLFFLRVEKVAIERDLIISNIIPKIPKIVPDGERF